MILAALCSLTLAFVLSIIILSQAVKSSPFPGTEVEITGNFTSDMPPLVDTNESLGNGSLNSNNTMSQTNQTNLTATNSTAL